MTADENVGAAIPIRTISVEAQESTGHFGFEEVVGLVLAGGEAFGKRAAIVFGHAVLPLEEVGDALRLDANFDAAEAGEEQVHLVAESGGGAEIFRRGMDEFNASAAEFEKPPTWGKFFHLDERGRGEVETFAADAFLRLLAEGLGAIGEEVGAGDFAFDENGVGGLLPSDGVGHLAADAGLLGEHDAATVVAEPADGTVD